MDTPKWIDETECMPVYVCYKPRCSTYEYVVAGVRSRLGDAAFEEARSRDAKVSA
jgi:hypothetical protein